MWSLPPHRQMNTCTSLEHCLKALTLSANIGHNLIICLWPAGWHCCSHQSSWGCRRHTDWQVSFMPLRLCVPQWRHWNNAHQHLSYYSAYGILCLGAPFRNISLNGYGYQSDWPMQRAHKWLYLQIIYASRHISNDAGKTTLRSLMLGCDFLWSPPSTPRLSSPSRSATLQALQI